MLLRKKLIHHADAVVTNGSSGRRYLTGLGADPSRVHVVHQASELDAQHRTHRPGGPLRLLFVGRLVSLKGLRLLLSALVPYQAGCWSLTVVGDGPERTQLQAFVSRQGLPVEFAGFVPRARLPELFSNHDVLVFPTLKDEWGLVVGEALRAGLPVLGSLYSEAVCEMVVDGVTGWVMRPDRPASIRAALNQLFAASDMELRRASELAHQSVQQLSPEVMADQFLDVLRTARNAGLAVPFGTQ
jgi:glycosyltransferase involved in cell wall biosynthesis